MGLMVVLRLMLVLMWLHRFAIQRSDVGWKVMMMLLTIQDEMTERRHCIDSACLLWLCQ